MSGAAGVFAGATYSPSEDDERLSNQLLRVFEAMKDNEWRTLHEIEEITGDPPASISAQLRHLRKKKFGSYVVEKRVRGARAAGLYEYRVMPPGTATVVAAMPKSPVFNKGAGWGLRFAAKLLLANPALKRSPELVEIAKKIKEVEA